MYYMEVALGQFSQLGPVAVWKMVPIGRGIGFAMCTLCVIGPVDLKLEFPPFFLRSHKLSIIDHCFCRLAFTCWDF